MRPGWWLGSILVPHARTLSPAASSKAGNGVTVLPVGGTDDEGLVYPNPGSSKNWTDPQRRAWQRRGEDRLDDKRTRALLRREGVPLATWSAGEVVFYDTTHEKQAAAARLHDAAERPHHIVASEWRAADGTVLLLLEHFCQQWLCAPLPSASPLVLKRRMDGGLTPFTRSSARWSRRPGPHRRWPESRPGTALRACRWQTR
jgi:hypothetical protein